MQDESPRSGLLEAKGSKTPGRRQEARRCRFVCHGKRQTLQTVSAF